MKASPTPPPQTLLAPLPFPWLFLAILDQLPATGRIEELISG
jgi:hypothetical protein